MAKKKAEDETTNGDKGAHDSEAFDCVIQELQSEQNTGTGGAKMKGAAGFSPLDFLPVVIAFLEWWKNHKSQE